MFPIYSLLYTLSFLVMSPLFLLRRGRYIAGFRQRLGNIPSPENNEKPVIWVHCVSVGETNAARPLIERLHEEFPQYSLVVSTTTATGQELARKLYKDVVEQVFYFPFDWKFSVRRALRNVNPKIVLILETEIWFRFFREANKSGAKVFIVNGRLSKRSVKGYSWIQKIMKRILHYVELALMQDHRDAKRLIQLGIRSSKVKVTGNLKFDQKPSKEVSEFTEEFRSRFAVGEKAPLIIAASTHEPEEEIVLHAFKRVWKESTGTLPRLVIAPRHPERFADVEKIIRSTGFDWARRSEPPSGRDKAAEVILLDSIGELRDVYPLCEIVFVGGSITPHGGQNILEPAFNEKAIVTGPHTENFASIVSEFVENDAIAQLPESSDKDSIEILAEVIEELIDDETTRKTLAQNALKMAIRDRGAAAKTIEYLKPHLKAKIPDTPDEQ